MTRSFLVASLLAGALNPAGTLAAQVPKGPLVADTSFRNFLTRWDASVVRMLNGDTAAFFSNASHAGDVTLLMPNGGVVTGWSEVSKRYQIAAGRMAPNSGATATFDYVAADVQGDLGYIVVIERSDYMFVGDTAMQQGVTRVTEAFRRENGQWKMMHRHMDHLPEQVHAATETMGKHC